MTIQQLIDALEKIQDKTKSVAFDNGYDTWSVNSVSEGLTCVFLND
jgi:hypothetical protein